MTKAIKAFFILINLIYLTSLKLFTGSKVKFSWPKIEGGLHVQLYGRCIIELKNIAARRNLTIKVVNGELKFGANCFVNNGCSFNSIEKITIGNNTIFGENVKLYDHNHIFSPDFKVNHHEFISDPIVIGSDCWIGSNVVILKGVRVVDNVIIGANALVNKSIGEPGVYVNKLGVLTKVK